MKALYYNSFQCLLNPNQLFYHKVTEKGQYREENLEKTRTYFSSMSLIGMASTIVNMVVENHITNNFTVTKKYIISDRNYTTDTNQEILSIKQILPPKK